MVRNVTVPISLANDRELVAMDIPLQFGQPGDGVELAEVIYSDRVDYFDVKVTNIDNENKTVVMGLIAMATDPNTPDLAPGTDPIAYLRFEVSDPTMSEFTIAATEMERPSHRLMLVSHEWDGDKPEIVWEEPDFNHTVVLSAGAGQLPASYALLQNYPNPFNAGTVIRFNVPQGDGGLVNVKLTIFNVLGQSVRTLVDDEQYAPGSWERAWDGNGDNGNQVASGVYFYRIQAGTFADTRKMTLLK